MGIRNLRILLGPFSPYDLSIDAAYLSCRPLNTNRLRVAYFINSGLSGCLNRHGQIFRQVLFHFVYYLSPISHCDSKPYDLSFGFQRFLFLFRFTLYDLSARFLS